jgi:hypothetical protein
MKYLVSCAKARSYSAAASRSKTSSVDHMSDKASSFLGDR